MQCFGRSFIRMRLNAQRFVDRENLEKKRKVAVRRIESLDDAVTDKLWVVLQVIGQEAFAL